MSDTQVTCTAEFISHTYMEKSLQFWVLVLNMLCNSKMSLNTKHKLAFPGYIYKILNRKGKVNRCLCVGICYLQRMLLMFYNAFISYNSYSSLEQRTCYRVGFINFWADESSSLVCLIFIQ